MRERDDGRHLALGAGAPADPDTPVDRPSPRADVDVDVLQAVTDFLDDLVEDTGEPA